jgi:NAD-dependent deacetylase
VKTPQDPTSGDRRSDLRRLTELLTRNRPMVAFTGAGISTESGISDFRSPGGVWSRSQPVYYHDFMTSAEARHEYWRQKAEMEPEMAAAHPNAGHRVLARWEQEGWLEGVITQNIDGLHQEAGSRVVYELHGSAREIACQDCGARFPSPALVASFQENGAVPPCPQCGGDRLKHATVSFGQALPAAVLEASARLARQAGLFLALGSSLVVEPAASLPRLAQRNGAKVVIVNRDPTPQDGFAELVVRGEIGATLTAVDEALHRGG